MLQATPQPYPQDYHAGHLVLIGPTGTGKTYYAKYITKGRQDRNPDLPVHVFVAPISAHDWQDPEADGALLVPAANVHTSWAAEEVDAIYEELRGAKKGLIVFDDFKSRLDYHHDRKFKEMFRTFRHLGTQVLAIGHTPTDVPPVVRENVTHCVLTFTSNREVVRDLANTYLAGDVARLQRVLAELQGHAVVKINARLNTIDVHTASGVTTSDVGIAAPPGGPGALDFRIGGPSLAQAGGAVNAQARGNVAVTGTYNDASVTTQYLRIKENLVAQQRMSAMALQDMRARSRLNQELELEREEHQARLTLARENQEAYALLHQPVLTAEEQVKLAGILARRVGNAGVTPHNFRRLGADRDFMAVYFPGTPYAPPAADIQDYGMLIPRLTRGDYTGLAGDLALTAVAAPPESVGGAVGLAAGALRGLRGALFGAAPPGLPAPAPARDPEAERKASLRAEIRRLALLHVHRRSTDADKARLMQLLAAAYKTEPVTRANYTKVALEFLRYYYPEDFQVVAARPHPAGPRASGAGAGAGARQSPAPTGQSPSPRALEMAGGPAAPEPAPLQLR